MRLLLESIKQPTECGRAAHLVCCLVGNLQRQMQSLLWVQVMAAELEAVLVVFALGGKYLAAHRVRSSSPLGALLDGEITAADAILALGAIYSG